MSDRTLPGHSSALLRESGFVAEEATAPRSSAASGLSERLAAGNRAAVLHAALLIVVLALPLIIGLRGVNYGLPYLYDVDELGFVDRSVAMVQRGSLDPGRYNHPGSTTYYSLSATYIALSQVAPFVGAARTPEKFIGLIDEDPTPFFLSGRLLTLSLTVVSLILTYCIARRLFSPAVGLMAVLFCGTTHLYLVFSTIVRTDLYMVAAVLLMFLLCVETARRTSLRMSVLAGAALGLAVSSKFPSAVFYLMLLATMVLVFWRSGLRAVVSSVVLSSLSAAATVVATSPFMFINWRETVRGVSYEARDEHLGATGGGVLSNLAWYLSDALVANVSWPGLILVALGAGLLLRSRRPIDRILAATPFVFIICVSFLGLRWERWLLPVLPLVAILLAYAIAWTVARVRDRRGPWFAAALGLALGGIVLWPQAGGVAQHLAMQAREDTRTAARQWILANVPPGSHLLVERYSPQLPRDAYRYFEVYDGELRNSRSEPAGRNIFPRQDMGFLEDVDDLRRRGIQYVVATWQYDRYLAEQEKYGSVVRGYEQIFSKAEPVMEWRSEDGPWRGPAIRVLRVK